MPAAELILAKANVLTMDAARPRAELVAISGGRIVSVGSNADLPEMSGAGSKVIDCQGKTLVPGFNDAHCHVFSLLRKLLSVDLSPPAVTSIEDIKAAIAEKARSTPPGQWITGTDYSEFHLTEKRHPTRWDIDSVAPEHPVVLSHRSLHACVLNSRALALAGITRETPEPPGARIERDLSDGEPNGVLYEMLGYIREKVMPPWSEEELERGIRLANQQYLAQGITSLQDATVVNDLRRWQAFRRFVDSGRLGCRVYMMAGWEAIDQFQEAGLGFGAGDDRLRLGAMKIVPSYAGGQLHPPQPELERLVLEAHRRDFQVAIHAVRQSTIEAAAAAFERVRRELPRPGTRHRIEHCAECPPALLERLRRLGVVIVTQPPFIYYSGERYLATVPAEQQPWLYRIKALLDAGLVVAASSDSPIVPNSPLAGIAAAVTRRAESGQELLPQEAISARQALAMYTTNAAYASFEEEAKGSITPGKLADLVLLSADPTTWPPEQIRDIRVEMTIIGGKVLWQA